MKVHYNIVKTRPSNVKWGKINAIAMGPLMHDQYSAIIANFMIFFSFLLPKDVTFNLARASKEQVWTVSNCIWEGVVRSRLWSLFPVRKI